MALKPSEKPSWSTSNLPENNQRPNSDYRLNGTLAGDPVPRQYYNYQEYWTGRWVDYVDAGMVDKDLNLSDLTNKPQALTNLGGTAVGKSVFTAGTTTTAMNALGMSPLGQSVVTALTPKDILRIIYPEGITYVQYPNCTAPNTLFGGTWELLFNTDGVFFRTEGGNALPFEGGIQPDELKSHSHELGGQYARVGVEDFALTRNGFNYTASPNSRTADEGGDETRPKNVTIRVWRKTSDVDS